jgi:hypothetical protein
MRAYAATSGVLYVALLLAHGARLAAEGSSPLHSPIFVVTSLGALAMALWSFRVWKAASGEQRSAASQRGR